MIIIIYVVTLFNIQLLEEIYLFKKYKKLNVKK